MASSTNTQIYGILDMLEAKGPTTETERVYRKVKRMHKQLLSLCAVVDQRPGAANDEQIVISEQPPVFGRPPGLSQHNAFSAVESEIIAATQKIIRADRSTNQKMAETHQKLKELMRRVKIVIHYQHRQLKMDYQMRGLSAAFCSVLGEEVLEESVRGQRLDTILGWFDSYRKATPAAIELAEQTRGGAFLLVPSENGWEGALESAKRALLLPPGFPDKALSIDPLNRIAALELQRCTLTKREGVRRKTVTEGKLRLISAPELKHLVSCCATGDAYELSPGNLQVIPVEASRGPILFSRWINFPGGSSPSAYLMYAELLMVNHMDSQALPKLLDGLGVLTSRLRWFMTAVRDFYQIRLKYGRGPLQLYHEYEDLMIFPRAYIRGLADNLADQVDDRGEVTEELMHVIKEMVELVDQTKTELFERGEQEDDDEEDSEEEESHEYFELDADLMNPPPENPGYYPDSEGDEPPAEMPSAPSRAVPHQERHAPPDSPRAHRSRSLSNESVHSELPGRPATTASQLRGDGPTHTIALQLQRSRQVLMSLVADPESSRYKKQREKVGKLLELAEKHLREDRDVSSSYEGFLQEEMDRSEDACGEKDDEFDIAEKKKKKSEDEKRDLLATLPRGLGQKFSGNPADWPNFRHHFERIVNTVDPTLAVAHMTSLVDCPKLKKRMKIYSNGEQLLKDFDKDFGFNFLNSSQSPRMTFMCLSNALNCPIKVLPSWRMTLIL